MLQRRLPPAARATHRVNPANPIPGPAWRRVLAEFGSAVGYCAALLEEAGVALTPGDDFDAVHGPESVRLSFAAGPDAVHEALERIAAWHAARGLA